MAGPPSNSGFTHAALEGTALAATQRARGPAVFPLGEPRAVVAGKDNKRVVGQFELEEGVEDLTDAPIDFLDPIAIRTIA